MRRTIAILAILAASAAAETPVYRTVDDAGQVTFSDRALPGAEPLSMRGVNTYVAGDASGPGSEVASTPIPAGESGSYESIEIVFPAPGATVRANGGEVRVAGRIVPALRKGHRPVLSFDGSAVPCSGDGPDRLACSLVGVARGPHAIRIDVFDAGGGVAAQTSVTRFHVLRTAAPIAPRTRMH